MLLFIPKLGTMAWKEYVNVNAEEDRALQPMDCYSLRNSLMMHKVSRVVGSTIAHDREVVLARPTYVL